MRWVRFVDRRPSKDGPNEYMCAVAGVTAFVYHVFIDSDSLTEQPNFYWLEGLVVPGIPEHMKHLLRLPQHAPPVPAPNSVNTPAGESS